MRDWVSRAVAFVNSLQGFGCGSEVSAFAKAPISASELAILQNTLPTRIPPPFAEFLTKASSALSCYYSIATYREPTEVAKNHFAAHSDLMQERINGGPTFFNIDNLTDGIQLCVDGADGLSDIWPDCSAKWLSAFPLIDIGNGDMIAFDVPSHPDNPPIVYLSHDENVVRTIAPDFTSFLFEWEKINYIGLEIWNLEEWGFLDSSTGYISVESGDLSGLLARF